MNVFIAWAGSSANRGCEAIVRTAVQVVQDDFPDTGFIASSLNSARDTTQYSDLPITLVPSKLPMHNPYWWLKRIYRLSKSRRADQLDAQYQSDNVQACDCVLSAGGDLYTLDYGMPWHLIEFDQMVRSVGVPLVLWGASVGPFPDVEFRQHVLEDLRAMDLILVRETVSRDYLASAGISENVHVVADGAFLLPQVEPEDEGLAHRLSSADRPLLGLNTSSIVHGRMACSSEEAIQEFAAFADWACEKYGVEIVFVPHVEGDRFALEQIQVAMNNGRHATLLPRGLSASEMKWCVARCKYFMGGRTHSTIASLSSCVPTVSISYSTKARGINRDIFGHEEHVLPADSVNRWALSRHLERIVEERQAIHECLRDQLPRMKEAAMSAGTLLRNVLPGQTASRRNGSGGE